MLKIRYIPFGGKTGLEIRDETGKHLFNLIPYGYTIDNNSYYEEKFVCSPCQFTCEDLLEAIHRLREDGGL